MDTRPDVSLYVMKHLQTLNFELQSTEKIISDLAQIVFLFPEQN